MRNWGSHFHHDDKEIDLLKKIEQDERAEIELDREQLSVEKQILSRLKPKLSSAKIAFTRKTKMPTQGPVTLQQGQSTVASVNYYDQTGQPMPAGFVPPAVTFNIDNPAAATSTPNSDGQTDAVAYVSAGVANLTINLTSAEGLALTDTETVTCSPIVVPPPVLTSAKIAFTDPSAVVGTATAK